jgi:hypothetical protein
VERDRWRRLHRRAHQDTVKRCGRGSVWLVARVWEMQTRGVLHVHPVLAYGTARHKTGARFYVARLAELASSYGFGFVERKVKPQPAVNAAAYLSSYFVKGRRGKATLWESARSASMPRSIVHVSVRLTQETGCTMRLLRFARFVWVLWAVRLPCGELRVAHELGFMAWAELVAAESPDRGPPPAHDGPVERGSASTGRPPVPPLPSARAPGRVLQRAGASSSVQGAERCALPQRIGALRCRTARRRDSGSHHRGGVLLA